MGNRYFPVVYQLLIQFGQIWTVLDQLLVQYEKILPVSDKNFSKLDQKLVWNRKIAFSHFGPLRFPVGTPEKSLSVNERNNAISNT